MSYGNLSDPEPGSRHHDPARAPTFDNLLYEVVGGVARLTLNRPAQRNGLNLALATDLENAVAEADEDDAVKVLLLKGNGPAFCGGYDMAGTAPPSDPSRPSVTTSASSPSPSTHPATAPVAALSEDADPGWDRLTRTLYAMRRDGEWWLNLFWNLRKPVVAQVHGACFAGGNDLIAAADIVVAAEDARFGLPQARGLGVIHTMGLWPYYMGIRKAKELAFTGDSITGAEAEALGLINKAVPADALEAEAMWLAERIALMPRQLLMAHKFAINRFAEVAGMESAVRGAGEYDAIGAQNWISAQFRRVSEAEGVRAAFAWRDRLWNEQAERRPGGPAAP